MLHLFLSIAVRRLDLQMLYFRRCKTLPSDRAWVDRLALSGTILGNER